MTGGKFFYRFEYFKKLNKEQEVEECDATEVK
jgi:hypothetical protein